VKAKTWILFLYRVPCFENWRTMLPDSYYFTWFMDLTLAELNSHKVPCSSRFLGQLAMSTWRRQSLTGNLCLESFACGILFVGQFLVLSHRSLYNHYSPKTSFLYLPQMVSGSILATRMQLTLFRIILAMWAFLSTLFIFY